jgi:hypothetical protein
MKKIVVTALSIGLLSVNLAVLAGSDCEGQKNSSSNQTQSQTMSSLQTMSSDSYFYPPYQTSLDKPIDVKYFNQNARRVNVEVKNMRTGQIYSAPLDSSSKHLWVGTIPSSAFGRNDEVQITFKPEDMNGVMSNSRFKTMTYDTLDTPESYSHYDLKNSRLRVVPFQPGSDISPAFNVYWPGLYYSKTPPYPVAARVTSSRAPENSVRKLDPIPGKSGWFQFQVPSMWYSPGEEITVDFTSNEFQKIDAHSDYPTGTSEEFVPLETVRIKTLGQ